MKLESVSALLLADFLDGEGCRGCVCRVRNKGISKIYPSFGSEIHWKTPVVLLLPHPLSQPHITYSDIFTYMFASDFYLACKFFIKMVLLMIAFIKSKLFSA